MTALIIATKSFFSSDGMSAVSLCRGVSSAVARFDEVARERVAVAILCIAALLLCFYVVLVNIILGEGGKIGVLERAIRGEEIALLDAEADFAIQSSAEQLKKNEVVRMMEDVGRVEYVRLGSPSLVEAFPPFP